MTGMAEACEAYQSRIYADGRCTCFASVPIFAVHGDYAAEMRLDPKALRVRVYRAILLAGTRLPVLEIAGVTEGPFLPRY